MGKCPKKALNFFIALTTLGILPKTPDEFCAQHLGVSRRNVERSIRHLEEFGPAFFHVSQLAHISAQEYRAIAGHVTAVGVRLDGTEIALLPENSERVAGAVDRVVV